jgi:hypothetical protein
MWALRAIASSAKRATSGLPGNTQINATGVHSGAAMKRKTPPLSPARKNRMRRAPLIACLLVTSAAVGCAGRSGHGHGGGSGEPGLEQTQRGVIAPDVTQVAALTQVDRILGYPRPGGQYHALSPADCQCMAVNAAPRANLLDDERRALAARESRGLCPGEDNSLTYDVLRTAALEDRNRQAGEALNDYYLLAQREAQLDQFEPAGRAPCE